MEEQWWKKDENEKKRTIFAGNDAIDVTLNLASPTYFSKSLKERNTVKRTVIFACESVVADHTLTKWTIGVRLE